MSITIPTTELIGCIEDVLPIVSNPKGAYAGVKIEWDGESLHFTAFDVYSGGSVVWTPGEGAEGDIDAGPDGEVGDPGDVDWGGEDDPWRVWIWHAQAKEILKLFKLPAKLWRFPVKIGVSGVAMGELVIEREDGPRTGRVLSLATENKTLVNIPDVRAIALAEDRTVVGHEGFRFAHQRLGSFGTVRLHGRMLLDFGALSEPVGVRIGTRYTGFIYSADAKHVQPFNVLRHGAGVVTSTQDRTDNEGF
jgi:hypothetical protein